MLWGGMQWQLEHHIFPTMPRYRYPAVSKRLKAFADEHGLDYRVSGVRAPPTLTLTRALALTLTLTGLDLRFSGVRVEGLELPTPDILPTPSPITHWPIDRDPPPAGGRAAQAVHPNPDPSSYSNPNPARRRWSSSSSSPYP